MTLNKLLTHKSSSSEKARILLLLLTGVAAVNISEATIHSGLGINVGNKLFPLNNHQRATLRNKLSEVKLVITDEISMVSSEFLCQAVAFWTFR